MKTNHRSNSSHRLGFLAGALGMSLGLLHPSPATAQTQTYPCETVMQFGTGMSTNGAKLRPGSVDPFFFGTDATFPDPPNTYVVTDPPAAWIANSASADSQWIGPSPSVEDDVAGTSVYRLLIISPCSGATLTGRYAASDRGALRLNGAPLSFPTPATGGATWTAFSFNNLLSGLNRMEFYVTNTPPAAGGPPGPSGLRAELTVTATCCPCIVLTCPSDIFLTTCSNGAPANFSITGTNRCFTNLNITCSLAAPTGIPVASGSVFPVGTNTVICNASDTVGHRTNCSFRVIVSRDSQPPQIRCPRDIVYLCSVSGTNVFYNVTATDDVDPNPVVTCVPPSGSYFPAGTNTVTCEARDSCGNISRCSFSVILAPDGFTKTLQAGVADNFSPAGFEAPFPGPCLAASTYWTGMPFDTSWPGRHLSHSFQGLPNNLSGAKLILHLKPTQPASQDDVLRIGLQNCGGPGIWAFAQPVASLPGAGGTWNLNPATTFTLDLTALPGGVNLLADLNANHRLEFAVGTETMVDYARLELTYCGPQSTLSGVPYSLNNVRSFHQGEGISWRTVNSNGPPQTVEIDGGQADGIQVDFDFGFDRLPICQTPGGRLGGHEGVSMDWPTGVGTMATAAITDSVIPGLTRISMSQPWNTTGKAIEVWNAGQLVARYYLAGAGDTAVNAPSNSCLFAMGFATSYFFANFKDPVSVQILTGQHVSGPTGGIATGDSIRLYYNLAVGPRPSKHLRVTLPPGGFDVAGLSLLHDDHWVKGFGLQLLNISDVATSTALIDRHPYGVCSPAYGPWTLDLNGVADFCTFDGFNPPVCNNGYVDMNLVEELNFGGLRLTPTMLPLDDCTIQNTVAGSVANSITVNRVSGGPVTINGATLLGSEAWPISISGSSGPQAFTAHFPPNTTVGVNGQFYLATSATFNAQPQFLGQFYQLCVETTSLPQFSFKSFHTIGLTVPPDCLTLNCLTGVVANCTGGAGTPVTFNVTGATRCGSNVVITCEPPSGSVFPPGSSIVQCSAIDSEGNQDQCRFLVTVRDVTPPTLVIPPRIIVPCDGPRGAIVEFSASATDDCDPAVVVECRPPSGSVFSVGTNYVTCSAIDAGGNRRSQEFPVIVAGGCAIGDCVDLTMPSNLVVRCNTAGGAMVSYTVTARDTCTGGPLTPTCVPPSGSVFLVGETRVVCTARSGTNEAYSSFLIEVIDDTPPELTCPSNLVVAAQSERGAVVSFTVTGRDDCAPRVLIRCTPPSGSVYPVGQTLVVCEGSDGYGNVAQCSFTVTVNKPAPLRVARVSPNLLELRWTGDAVVEFTDLLSDEALWRTLTGTPESNGVERVLRILPTGSQRFFRLRLLDLLPLPDADGDGVPDIRDRCPETPAGLPVDPYGCALFDLITTPERVFDPERAAGGQTLRLLELDGGFTDLVARLSPALVNSNSPSVPLRERLLPGALNVESNFVQVLRGVLNGFLAQKGRRIAEIEGSAPPLDPEHADVRPQDWELMRLEEIELGLLDTLRQSETSLVNLSNVVKALTVRDRRLVTIQSFDAGRGAAQLTDGRLLVLPSFSSPGAPALESIRGVFTGGSGVQVEASQLPDGSWFGLTAEAQWTVNPGLVKKLNPRTLALRIVPVSDWDTGVRHRPKAYKWGFTEDADGLIFLDTGMGLAVTKLNSGAEPGFKHWVQIWQDVDNDGSFQQWDSSINETSPPISLSDYPLNVKVKHPFPILVREFRHPIASGGWGTPDLVSEETLIIRVRDSLYAGATYSRTIFELEDRPDETSFQSAKVVSLERDFPLTLQPMDEQSFKAKGFTVSGNSSSYPQLNPVQVNTSFAVRFQDYDTFATQGTFVSSLVTERGLYEPTLSGLNHGLPFTYGVSLPSLVRDRLHSCTGTDTYYRIPVPGVWGVSQGNNGTSTHKLSTKYAFDFPGTHPYLNPVLAARGGIVQAFINPDPSCGNGPDTCSGLAIKILHQDGTQGVYYYVGMGGFLVGPGQRVYRGDLIGVVSTLGLSITPHLHFHVVEGEGSTESIPIKFETYDVIPSVLRDCYVPPHNSHGFSTNFPWD